ncbi:EAL domain-containing protein [Pinirhizobacter sp.]|jgi:diguanylate cyclase (GGDEF)-like protein/PAS domain S-box-containing protein|uniref:EAL domain-containing protein n=1 Tax=Pinirhizobacter sp. TaxID=2950432 RepID=UPI002F3F8891
MKQDNVIKIAFVEDSVEQAEQLINVMRNGGIAVRPSRAGTPEEFTQSLDESPDIVLVNPSTKKLDVATVVRQVEASGKDVSIIAIIERFNEDTIADLFTAGIRGVALRSRPEQTLAIVRREFESLTTRRHVRRLETALRESERRCDALLDSSRDAIAYVHEGMHVRANQAYLEQFGFEEFDDILGLPILDMIASEDADRFKSLLRNLSRGDKPPVEHIEFQARRGDGNRFKTIVEFAHATFEGEPCLQIVFRREIIDPNVVAQLTRDTVTGLWNRAHTLELVDRAVASAADGETGRALLLVEPDNWKDIVPAIGMGNADQLFAGIATRIRDVLDEDDEAGVLGEHTIGVVLHARSDAEVHGLIENLRSSVAAQIFDVGSRSITVSLTVGGSLLAERNANTETLLEQASTALRNAQSQGGNRSEVHDPSAREKADAERDLYWLNLVRDALESDNFLLYHQQIISLQDAAGEFYEILVRMRGPNGDVLPSYFMPVAERHGMLPAVDRWVLDHALDTLRQRERDGLTTTYFVKLTLASLHDATLLPWLAQRMGDAKLRRSTIVVEMPESKVLTSLRPAQEFVTAWKKVGGRFGLEQFGSGLNSFQMLTHVDADYLKIDRSFMTELPQHPENQKKIAEICTQARTQGKQTIAEWVEDAASTSLLFACGVDFVQGNFLQEPVMVVADRHDFTHA